MHDVQRSGYTDWRSQSLPMESPVQYQQNYYIQPEQQPSQQQVMQQQLRGLQQQSRLGNALAGGSPLPDRSQLPLAPQQQPQQYQQQWDQAQRNPSPPQSDWSWKPPLHQPPALQHHHQQQHLQELPPLDKALDGPSADLSTYADLSPYASVTAPSSAVGNAVGADDDRRAQPRSRMQVHSGNSDYWQGSVGTSDQTTQLQQQQQLNMQRIQQQHSQQLQHMQSQLQQQGQQPHLQHQQQSQQQPQRRSDLDQYMLQASMANRVPGEPDGSLRTASANGVRRGAYTDGDMSSGNPQLQQAHQRWDAQGQTATMSAAAARGCDFMNLSGTSTTTDSGPSWNFKFDVPSGNLQRSSWPAIVPPDMQQLPALQGGGMLAPGSLPGSQDGAQQAQTSVRVGTTCEPLRQQAAAVQYMAPHASWVHTPAGDIGSAPHSGQSRPPSGMAYTQGASTAPHTSQPAVRSGAEVVACAPQKTSPDATSLVETKAERRRRMLLEKNRRAQANARRRKKVQFPEMS